MKTIHLLSLVVFIGCGSARDYLQPQSPRLANALEDDVIYSLRIRNDTVNIGDPIDAEFKIWNLSREDREFVTGDWDPIRCLLLDSSAHLVGLYPMVSLCIDNRFSLKAKEAREIKFTLDPFKYGHALSPGVYTLRACVITMPRMSPELELLVRVR
jgi:hypothetical protein